MATVTLAGLKAQAESLMLSYPRQIERIKRGAVLAATTRIRVHPVYAGTLLIDSDNDAVTHEIDPAVQVCSCPDYQFRPVVCKHLFAVEIYGRAWRAAQEAGK